MSATTTQPTHFRITGSQVDHCLVEIAQVAKGISHDLNNSLQGFGIGFDLVSNSATPGSALEQYLGLLQGAAERLKTLTKRLRLLANLQEHRPATCSVAEVLGSGVAAMDPDARKLASIEIEDVVNLPAARFDLIQITGAIAEVLNNGAESANGSPVNIHVSARTQPFCEIDPSREGTAIGLHFHDTGLGIAESLGGQICSPFHTTKGKGRGLGLFMVKAAVIRNSGAVEINSSTSGTRISLYLPQA